ncbi:recombinase [Escherichia coli]|uniref:Tyr recombinase domain-containing protein n=1 Tax=Escherichia coli TaxID=562 RepID=Q08JM8_ECOLX|nr:hypothetical protein [Escherichia coli]GDF46622.1 recombinase [Escherichia coli]
MNNVIPLQNSPERVSLLPIAPGVDFATALSLRRMATSTGATPAYLLAPEVSALLFYMPDQRHHMLFATLWNTGMRIGEARMLTPESFDLDGVRPFVRILSEKVRARRGRPPKDEVRLVPLTDISYVRQMESWMITTRPRRREPLWAVTDETMRNWLKQALRRAEADGYTFRFRSHHIPSGTAISCTCSITASPGKSSRHWLVTGIHVRWRFIPECLHWIWLPRWQCLSQVTGGMLRRSCVHCLP